VDSRAGLTGNRELLACIANHLMEAREHSTRVRALYRILRDLPYEAHGHHAELFLQEQERHHKRDGELLEQLRRQLRMTNEGPQPPR
jgi:lipopolysaccharide biosynthesis regulator YciM